jgi:hypothetical protein
MENKRGSSSVVNTSKIFDALKSLKRYLRSSFTTKSRPLSDYAALFVYSNVDALDTFVDFCGDCWKFWNRKIEERCINFCECLQ